MVCPVEHGPSAQGSADTEPGARPFRFFDDAVWPVDVGRVPGPSGPSAQVSNMNVQRQTIPLCCYLDGMRRV